MTSIFFRTAAAVALVSSSVLAGCAANTGAIDDDMAEETNDELSAAGQELLGSYEDDSGAFRSLVLTTKKVGKRNAFVATVDTGIRCITTPCPSSETIEGTFTAGKKTITFYSTTASSSAQHLLGKYKYLVQGEKFTLMRDGSEQSLAKVSDASEIWPSDATKLVAEVSGGFMPPPPPGSSCSNGATYSLDRAARKLTWTRCEFNGRGPRTLKSGTTALSNKDVKAVDDAMNSLRVSNANICGADKPFQTITVSTPEGDKKYVDDFYSCRGGDSIYVDNIGNIFSALDSISGGD